MEFRSLQNAGKDVEKAGIPVPFVWEGRSTLRLRRTQILCAGPALNLLSVKRDVCVKRKLKFFFTRFVDDVVLFILLQKFNNKAFNILFIEFSTSSK